MNIFDIDYNKKEKNLFKYHYTCLLSELLILNYEFSNHEYNGTLLDKMLFINYKRK